LKISNRGHFFWVKTSILCKRLEDNHFGNFLKIEMQSVEIEEVSLVFTSL